MVATLRSWENPPRSTSSGRPRTGQRGKHGLSCRRDTSEIVGSAQFVTWDPADQPGQAVEVAPMRGAILEVTQVAVGDEHGQEFDGRYGAHGGVGRTSARR